MAKQFTVVGLGEALWDVLPSGKVLGGAPLNVACHAHQLLGDRGEAVVASRVGTDELGDEVIQSLSDRDMPTNCVERDPNYPTSTVTVALKDGQPTYTFAADIAWDHLEFTPEWAELAKRCDAVCFGTLAQRSRQSRETIWEFLHAATKAVRLFDVNLRQGFYDRESTIEGCRHATIVKLNEDELPIVADHLGHATAAPIEQLATLRRELKLAAVVYTRGKRGTLLMTADGATDAAPASYPAAPQADAVGAGDACTAAILTGWLMQLPPERIAEIANHLGAYVASQHGATPQLPASITAMFQ